MKLVIKILTLAVLLSASHTYASDKPIMIVRFNKEIVDFQSPLSAVTDASLSVKPNVFFDIVSILPDVKRNKSTEERYRYQTNSIVSELKFLGVSDDKIRVTYQRKPNLRFNEVHLFVR